MRALQVAEIELSTNWIHWNLEYEPAYIYYVCGAKIMTALKFKRRDNQRNKTFRTLYIRVINTMFELHTHFSPLESTLVCFI